MVIGDENLIGVRKEVQEKTAYNTADVNCISCVDVKSEAQRLLLNKTNKMIKQKHSTYLANLT